MPIKTGKQIVNEINKLGNRIAELKLKLEKIQLRCKHEKTKNVDISKTLKSCVNCHKEIVIPPTTSIFPPGAHNW